MVPAITEQVPFWNGAIIVNRMQRIYYLLHIKIGTQINHAPDFVDKMADPLGGRNLVINPLLCFLVSKIDKLALKRLRDCIVDNFKHSEVETAKKLLLNHVASHGLTELLPRYPARQGDKQFINEIEDILNAITILDEQKSLNKLPVFVTHDTNKIPSLPLDDGEYSCLLNKIDKLEDVVMEMKATLCTVLAGRPNSTNVQPPTTSLNPLAYNTTSFPPLGKPACSINSATSALPRSQQAMNSVIGARPKNKKINSVIKQRVSSIASSDDETWATVESKKKKRRLNNSQQQQQQSADSETDTSAQRQRQSTNQRHQQQQQHPARTTDNRQRRSNIVVGKCMNQPNIAAKPFKQVYCVDNVSLSVNEDSLTNMFQELGVRVYTCFEVAPRMSARQRQLRLQPNHRTFRLCINKADRKILLNPDKLPADISISKYFFKGSRPRDNAESDTDIEHGATAADNGSDTLLAAKSPLQAGSLMSLADEGDNISNDAAAAALAGPTATGTPNK